MNYLCKADMGLAGSSVFIIPQGCAPKSHIPGNTPTPPSLENPSHIPAPFAPGSLLFPALLPTLWELFLLPFFPWQNLFVPSGALVDLQSYQNSRFGSCIAAVPDLNQDSYNDLVVGAPLEDEHQGAIYVFLGFQETVLKKYKQVGLPCVWFPSSSVGINNICPYF